MLEKNNLQQKKKVFLATGGSGGHIFPAVSVAKILSQNGYDVRIVSDIIYEKYADNFNFKYTIIDTGKTFKKWEEFKKICFAILTAKKLLVKEKPDLVIGFGSYATFPLLSACVLKKIPFLLHEQNVYIGKTNKIFGRRALKIMTAYYEIFGLPKNTFDKIIYTGQPVREEIKKLNEIEYKIKDTLNILITGGSLGAKIFAEKLPYIFDFQHKELQKNLKIYHQIQTEYIDEIDKYYKSLNLDAEISPFFNNMGELLEKSHLVIGRAGNGTLTETAIAGKPAIFIPLPTAAANHQEKNARLYERNGGIIVILEKDFDTLQKTFFSLIQDKAKLENMANKNKKSITIDGDKNILNVVNEFFNCKISFKNE